MLYAYGDGSGAGVSPTQKQSFWGILYDDVVSIPHGPPQMMTGWS
jgi:hypothetical protein